MPECYQVSMEIRVLVVAENRIEAMDIGRDAIAEQIFNADISAHKALYLPPGWGNNTLVYHAGKEDMTAEDALKLNKV